MSFQKSACCLCSGLHAKWLLTHVYITHTKGNGLNMIPAAVACTCSHDSQAKAGAKKGNSHKVACTRKLQHLT